MLENMSSNMEHKAVKSASTTKDEKVLAVQSVELPALASVRPRTLHRTGLDIFLLITTDILMALAWTGMFIYAVLVWYGRNKLVNDVPFSVDKLLQAATTLSTLFSILFAASFSRVLRSLALWLLERGSTVELLDQLVGSLSVSSALMTQINTGLHRNIISYLLGLMLIILWLLSPLGSQAVLRISSLAPIYQNDSASVLYMNTTNWSGLPPGGSDSMFTSNGADILFNAALVGPESIKTQTRDAWSHVKIPKLSHTNAEHEDVDGWRPINIRSLDDYSSLFGLPVDQLHYAPGQTVDFSVESSYWNIACDKWSEGLTIYDELVKSLRFNASYTNPASGPAIQIFFNLTGTKGDYSVTRPACFSQPDAKASNQSVECSARQFVAYIMPDQIASACTMSTEYVETQIKCNDGACSPIRIRRSVLLHPNTNWTVFDAQAGGSAIDSIGAPLTNQGSFWNNFARVLAGKTGTSGNALAGYILNPAQPFLSNGNTDLRGGNFADVSLPSMLTIDNNLITSRFAQVVNSYYVASIGNVLITGSKSTWQDAVNKDQSLTTEYNGFYTNATSTSSVIVMTQRQKLRCSLPWLLVFTVVTVLSLISAVIGLMLTWQIKGPRLAMNITTMLRDNRYSHLGSNASYMDDSDRSRKSRGIRVRICDVAAGENVGHIAISTTSDVDIDQTGGLQKDRPYD